MENYNNEEKNEVLDKKTSDWLNFLLINKKYILIILGIIIAVIVSVAVCSIKYSHVGTYKCVSSNGTHEKVVLKRNGKYTKTDDPSGYYEIDKKKVILKPSNGEDEIVLLREGEYLYSNRGWYENDSPYYKQKLPKGKKIDQVLTYRSDGGVGTVIGYFSISLDRTLELNGDGTYMYEYGQNNNGNKMGDTEKGKYVRTKKELKMTTDSGKKYILPIVDNKVVYVQTFRKE